MISVKVVSPGSLTDAVRESSFCCFFLYTRDVADLSELTVARNAQSPFVCARDTSVRCVQGSSQFAFRWFLVEPHVSPHLNPNRTDCVRVQRSVISIVNCLVRDSSSFVTSPRVIVNHTPSARVIIVFDDCLHYLHLMIYTLHKSGSGARVTVNGMSGVEGQDPAGTDPIDLQLPRSATSSGTPQTSTPSVTRLIDTKSLLQVTPYHGDKASFLGWKWSFLIAVRAISKPLCEGFKKIEDNINQDFRKSRLSAGDVELSDQAYTLIALLFKDEACAYVRSAEDGNGCQAWQALLRARTARNATNL